MNKAHTPCEEYASLASKMGLERVFLKREDMHPYGSHKGRSIPHMIDEGIKSGAKSFVISSSGNAALAAAIRINEIGQGEPMNATLDIYIGQNANKHKVEKLEAYENDAVRIIQKERPLQALILAEQDGATSLRQSTNDSALIGYNSLAEEIVEQIKKVSPKSVGAVFIGTSSGTTAQALASYMIENKLPIQIHIVQTSSCHPIADAFDINASDLVDEQSVADAIVDQTAHRKNALIPLIQKTGGRGWIVSNEEIITAQELVSAHAGIDITPNGVLGVAGAIQASFAGHNISGPTICIVCGE